MNNERRRINDLTMLSAYLDKALKEKEVENLEARLEKEPELQEKLENLRRTKILLNHLDHIPAPRNYTLTPDMVRVQSKKNKPLFATLRLATSFAAILLVALFGIQLLLPGGLMPVRMQSDAPMLEVARVEEEMTPEPLIFWAESGSGGTAAEGYGGGGPDSIVEESYTSEEAMEENEEAAAEEPEIAVEQPKAPSETEIESQEALELENASPDEDIEDNSPILGINPEQGGQILERSQDVLEEQQISPDWSKIILWTQIILGVIAVGGGLTLWLLRKKA